MIVTHEQLLSMIEQVAASDEKELQRINNMFWCWYNTYEYEEGHTDSVYGSWWGYRKSPNGHMQTWPNSYGGFIHVPDYTTSRDALKTLRPEGWIFNILNIGSTNGANCEAHYPDMIIDTPNVATEELAELHGIIQVSVYIEEMKHE